MTEAGTVSSFQIVISVDDLLIKKIQRVVYKILVRNNRDINSFLLTFHALLTAIKIKVLILIKISVAKN